MLVLFTGMCLLYEKYYVMKNVMKNIRHRYGTWVGDYSFYFFPVLAFFFLSFFFFFFFKCICWKNEKKIFVGSRVKLRVGWMTGNQFFFLTLVTPVDQL